MSNEAALSKLMGTISTTPPQGAPNAKVQTTQPNPNTTGKEDASQVQERAPESASTQFTALARREAKLVQDRERIKKEQEEFAPVKTKAEQLAQRLERFEQLKDTDAIGALEALGYSETQIFNILSTQAEKEKANETLTPEEKATRAAQKVIDDHKAEIARENETKVAQSNAAAINRLKGNITSHLETNKDLLPYCEFNGALAEDLVFSTIAQVLRDTTEYDAENRITKPGELISVDEAYQMVEGFYKEEDEAMTKKIKVRGGTKQEEPLEPTTKTKEEPLKPQVNPGMPGKTLAGTKVNTTTTIPRRETSEQKRDRLISKLRAGG